jgi:translocator protein
VAGVALLMGNFSRLARAERPMAERYLPNTEANGPSTLGRSVAGLLGWLAVVASAALAGGIASAGAGGFYQQLDRPEWAPPAWLFSPVWTALYLLMALAAWLVWRVRGLRRAQGALTLFVLQLVANAVWPWLFFAWRQGALALAGIVVLGLLVLATIAAFWRIRPLAAGLLVPYVAWISYAAALNLAIWQRNPALLG